MIRSLAALLLAAVPLNAQVVRVNAPTLVPTAVVPGAVFAVPFTAAPSLFAPSLSATPLLSAPALLSAPLPSLPVAAIEAAPAPAAAPALTPASAAIPTAAADGPRKRASASPAAPKAAFVPTFSDASDGSRMFDGASDFKTRSGSVFAVSATAHPAVRGVALVRVQASPASPVKEVSGTQGLSGAPLLAKVGQIAAQGHHGHDYHEASHYLFGTADNHAINGVHGVADAYSGVFVPGTSQAGADYSETGDPTHDGWSRKQGMNVEHVFPQSLFEQKLPMRSDLHHLMATFEHPNGMRGNLPFGVVKGQVDYRNDAGAKRGGGVFEPPDFTKGRVARAMLYFYARYKDTGFFDQHAAAFWNGQVDVLLDWNRRFPPTVEEVNRNGQVEAFQGNRNPFVDDPRLADRIGADALRSPLARVAARVPVKAETLVYRRSDKPRKGKKRKQSYTRGRGRQIRR